MPKVSIIMPSLNVAPYIRECMDSVICQTLGDIEILCVDAGSTDGTWEILGEYAQKDRRIRLIESEKKSYGYQMNLGIREAAGEYIGIVETDDFVLPQMFETLYDYAKEHDADVVKSDFDIFTTFRDGGRVFLKYSLAKYSGAAYHTSFSSDAYISFGQKMDVFIWNGIYRREFLLKSQILFQETPGAAFQDCGFRYQTALHLKRGFFLDQSFYRYRRDNINSSTYNPKCVLFNLAECKNLIRIAEETYGDNSKQMTFLAREIAGIVQGPYVELLTWGQPAEETNAALEEFRTILKGFIRKGTLNPASLGSNAWFALRLFVDDAEFYDAYAHLKAEVIAETTRAFLAQIEKKESVILFGGGFVGACAYCLIRNNGINTIAAFTDNDQTKWGSTYCNCQVLSPKEAARRYPDAFFLITNAAHAGEIGEQLRNLGVAEEQTMVYTCSTFPLDCTNRVMRGKQK